MQSIAFNVGVEFIRSLFTSLINQTPTSKSEFATTEYMVNC